MSEIIENLSGSETPDKAKLPYEAWIVKMLAGDTNSVVMPVKGFRGIAINLPALSNVTSVSIYVSPKDVGFGEPGSLMVKLPGVELVPVDDARNILITSFIAENWFAQVVYDQAETVEHELAASWS